MSVNVYHISDYCVISVHILNNNNYCYSSFLKLLQHIFLKRCARNEINEIKLCSLKINYAQNTLSVYIQVKKYENNDNKNVKYGQSIQFVYVPL